MKKFITLIFVLAMGVSLFAQTVTTGPYTYPRFGSAKGTVGNSCTNGACLNYKNIVTKCTLSETPDTLKIAPNAYETVIKVTALDTLVITITSTANLYAGDKIVIYATGTTTTNRFYFAGTSFFTNPDSCSTGATFKAFMSLIWDGSKFIELNKKRY